MRRLSSAVIAVLPIVIVACSHGGGGTIPTPQNPDDGGASAFGQVTVTPEPSTNTPIELSSISASFEDEIAPESVTSSTFSLAELAAPQNAVSGQLSVSANSLTFDISQKLTPRTYYLAKISGDLELQSGAKMGSEYSWTFRTADPEQGFVLGTTQIVNSVPDFAEQPHVAWDPHRNVFHIVWRQRLPGDVSFKAYENTASVSPFLLDSANSVQIGPADQHVFNMGPVVVSPAADQTVHLNWTQYPGSLWATQETGSWDSAMEMDPSALCDSPNLTVDPVTGTVYAAWVQAPNGFSVGSLLASYRLPGSALDSWVASKEIGNTLGQGDVPSPEPRYETPMAVSRLDGALHVAWELGNHVYARKLSPGGAAWGDAWEPTIEIGYPLESYAPGSPNLAIDEHDPSQYTLYVGFFEKTYLGQFGADGWGYVYFVNRRKSDGSWEGSLPITLPKILKDYPANGPASDFSSLVVAADGTVYAAALYPGPSGGFMTHVARFRPGSPWTKEGWDAFIPIFQTSSDQQRQPKIVIRPDGKVLVLWIQGKKRVLASQYDPANVWSGQSWSDPVYIDGLPDLEYNLASFLEVASDPVSGTVLAVFCKQVGDNKQVFCSPIF